MKPAGMLLITISLIVGVLAATTAYTPHIDAISASQYTLTLKGPVGTDPEDDEKPLVDPEAQEGDVKLTADLVERLRNDASVTRVPVKEFRWELWDGKWWFTVAVVGLFAGAMLLRLDRRQRILASVRAVKSAEESPAQALRNADQEIRQLVDDISTMTNEQAQLDAIIRRVGSVQRSHFTQFVDARPELVGRLGLTRYSQMMDQNAAAERAFNRAWSAAADGIAEEAELSLREGIDRLEKAMKLLPES